MWMIVRPASCAANRGVPRPSTASVAASSASMRMTVRARWKTSAGAAATADPACRNGSQRAAVRFQTISGVPARARLSAMGCPMIPSPMNPAGSSTVHHPWFRDYDRGHSTAPP